VVGRFVARESDLFSARLPVASEDKGVEMQGISATSVSITAGRRWGLLVSVLDIAKAALVTLAFRLMAPDEPAYLVAATFAVAGHIWPLWHRFRGGFGISPMLGGVAVVDPFALLVTLPLGAAIGWWRANTVLTVSGWSLFLVPWFLISSAGLATVLYGLTIVLIHWFRMRRLWSELRGQVTTLAPIHGRGARGR
jgi:glycerol-3-phosphate acyltransferase PlsY